MKNKKLDIIGIAAAFAVLLLIIGKRSKRRREDE